MKRKIMAIWVILVLITIQFGIVNAGQTLNEQDENVQVQMTAILQDESIQTKTLYVTEKELTEIQQTISLIIKEIETSEEINIEKIIDNLPIEDNPKIISILKSLFNSKSLISRSFIVSIGNGYKLNPLAHSKLKIRKRFTFWFYPQVGSIAGKTIFIKPLMLKIKTLNGSQIGFMHKFTGIYFSVVRKIPNKGFTFFMGTAKNVRGLQLSPTIQT